MHRTLQGLAHVALATLVLWSAGCEKGHRRTETGATLEGTITYGSQKVPAALVIVAGKDHSATGNVGEDGRYKVENAPLGEVNIGVNTAAARGEMQSKIMAEAYKGPGAKGVGKASKLQIVDVPGKYGTPESSGITTTVNKGANTYDIVIK